MNRETYQELSEVLWKQSEIERYMRLTTRRRPPMTEPVYLVLNGPHRGKRYPAIAGETLALPDYESLDSFPATTTVLYTLRVLAVDDPDGTRKANRFWLTADTPTSATNMLDLLIDLAEEAVDD